MKLHRILFYLLVILLPVQLGRHFWPDFAFVFGIRVDYLSPTVYLTDILVIVILALWAVEGRKKIKYQISNIKITYENLIRLFLPLVVFGFLGANVFFAQNSGAALYKFVKIAEFALLGFYVAKNSYSLSIIHSSLSIALVYSSLLALAQFLKQASLGGYFWWLGERTFNLSTPGIARAIWGGRLILRPYATFPHPNVLAGFILVSLILSVTSNRRQATRKSIKWLAIILGLVTLAISFSRSTWIIGALVCFWLLIRYLRTTKLDKKILLFVVCSLLFVLGALFYFAPQFSTEEAVVQRLQLNQAAIEMIKQNPVVGVGLNNFIPQLTHFWPGLTTVRFLQPVHNVFLLVAAETGLVGLLIFLWFLILTFKKLLVIGNWKPASPAGRLVIPLLAILSTGVTDHYWLTLQQTQLLFAIVLGLSWGTKKAKIKEQR